MINSISLDYLKIFYEVAKLQSVSKASKTLLISQPAISQTLNKLEDGLGVKLFLRSNKGAFITPIGQKIYERVGVAMANIFAINTIITEDSNLMSGKIIIGCGTNIAKKLLTKPIQQFSKLYPDILFTIIDDAQIKFLQQIKNGEMDVCIIQKSFYLSEDVLFHTLINERYVFVASPKLNIKNNNDFFEKQKFIVQPKNNHSRNLFENFCKTKGVSNLSVIEVVGYNLSVEFALHEIGVAMVPNYLVEDYIKNGLLIELKSNLDNPVMEYGYCISKQYTSKALQTFLTFLNKK